MFQRFPLLALSIGLYAALDLTVKPNALPWYEVDKLHVIMLSGDTWKVSGGHMFDVVSLGLLFIELLKATRSDAASLTNHALSAIVFITAVLLFVNAKGYGNTTFFLLTAMTFLDFMAGFIITTAATRRDISFGPSDD